MFRIRTMNKISDAGLSRFDGAKYSVGEDSSDPHAIILRSASLHGMSFPDSLSAIARAGAGTNNIPVDECSKNGIVVFNTPGANSNAVKELTIAAIIGASRNIFAAFDWLQTLKGKGSEVPKLVEKGKSQFKGPEICGKSLGVIGLGAIGVKVANAALGLGMEVYGYDPYLSLNAAWNVSGGIHRAKSLTEIFNTCDYITVHVPLNKETQGTFCKDSISQMKDGVRLFNLARGGLAVSTDIKAGIESGKIASYTTDFADDTLIGVPGVTALPHLGASTPESENNCAAMAAMELIDFLENGNIKNSVNFPNIELAKSAVHRVTVIHKNVPSMLSQISSSFSARGINIAGFVSNSRGDLAYTIADTDDDMASIALGLQKIDGVCRVRIVR